MGGVRPNAREKRAKSALRATFGLPKVPVAVCTSLGLAGRPEKREYPRQIGSHPGNPGLDGLANCMRQRSLAISSKNNR
jgi:hypothetical protein